jgi:hypothetical protein
MILLVIEESIALDEVVREIEVEEAFIGARTIESHRELLLSMVPDADVSCYSYTFTAHDGSTTQTLER